jgi:anti-sigma factor RsiW
MHPDDGVLQALLDDELNGRAAMAARDHLASCIDCRSRLDALRADDALVTASLPALDHSPVSTISASAIVARGGRARTPVRWAAVVALLLLAAGAAYALPGSPLRHWIAGLVQGRPKQRSAAGIAIEPGTRFRIVFTPPPAHSSVTIALTAGSMIEARRIAGTARFTAGLDELVIEPGAAPGGGGKAGGDFAIDLPRTAPWVEVVVGDRRIFLKDGGQISTAARPDSLGRYILPLY